MSNRWRKLLLILGFILLVVLFAYLLWSFFFKESIIPSPSPGTEIPGLPGGLPGVELGEGDLSEYTDPGRLPDGSLVDPEDISQPTYRPDPEADRASPIASGGLTETKVVVPGHVFGSTITSSGALQYYNQDDGYFYRLNANGQIEKMSDQKFFSVSKVTWAPNSESAILEYPDESKILYNFSASERKQVTLPFYWNDFSFSNDSQKIAAISHSLDEDNRWLIVANSDGSKAQPLEFIGDNQWVFPSWSPNNSIVAYHTRGYDANRREIFFVGQHGENLKSTLAEGRGIETEWSKTGDRLLYSAYHPRDDYKPRLWIVDANTDSIGNNRLNLGLNTWVNKCTFASETDIYCAVPESLDVGAGLVPELARNSRDLLYKIDLNTGAKNLIAVPEGSHSISQILVSERQDYLYFVDQNNGALYQINLR